MEKLPSYGQRKEKHNQEFEPVSNHNLLFEIIKILQRVSFWIASKAKCQSLRFIYTSYTKLKSD